MSNASRGDGAHGKRGTTSWLQDFSAKQERETRLSLLRERILVQERIVARCEARVAKWTAYPSSIPQLLSEAMADLKETQGRLTELRREMADSVREVL